MLSQDLINRYTARVAGIILVFGTPNHFSAFVYVLSVRIKFMANEKRLQKECRAYREPSIGILLAFFFWMMIPLAIIATVWIGLGDGFDRVHLLGAYPAVAMTPVEGATSTKSRAQSQIATATVASNTPRRWQRETRHTLPDQRSI